MVAVSRTGKKFVAAGRKAIPPVVLVLCFGLLMPASAQRQENSRWVFQPGSRQAVEVSPQNTPNYSQGGFQRFGGMRSGGSTQGYYGPRQSGNTVSRQQVPGQAASVSSQQGIQTTSVYSQQGVKTTSSQSNKNDYVDAVVMGNRQRKFRVHLPSSYNRSRPTPVMLVFSGLQMSGESMIGVTGFNGIANRNDFIVVYGESAGGEWEDGMKNQRHDDVGYVQAVLARLSQTVNVDTHRIYAVGLSNGGYFCQLLACSMPEKIAAIAVVASTGMEQALTRSHGEKPIPVVFYLGTEDPLINWGDTKPKKVGELAAKLGVSGLNEIDPGFISMVRYGGWYTVPDLINFWTNHNHCAGPSRTSYEPDRDPNDGMRVKKEAWGNRGNEVILYSIEGGGHTWPGNIFLAGQTKSRCCQDINTGESIWEFFRYQSR